MNISADLFVQVTDQRHGASPAASATRGRPGHRPRFL